MGIASKDEGNLPEAWIKKQENIGEKGIVHQQNGVWSPGCQVGGEPWVYIAKEVAVAWFAGPVGDELIGVAFEQGDIPS